MNRAGFSAEARAVPVATPPDYYGTGRVNISFPVEDLHVKDLAFGLGEDFLLGLGECLQFRFDLLNALHE
jgi:hypothetical protein